MDASKLRERLRSVVGFGASRVPPAPAHPTNLLSGDFTPAAGPSDVASALGGEWRDAPAGSCFVVERRIARDSYHGRTPVGRFAADIEASLESARILSHGTDARVPLLFFDLETTGLSGGAGTYAFLIGCGWFDGDGTFATRQYVLAKPADEPAMLRAFAAQLAASGALVSFNGRTFDAPVLETRYLYHRLAWAGCDLPHLDMLHPARRFWGNHVEDGGRDVAPVAPVIPSCSLGALERRILGASRAGDVPGFEIPARYFEFIRSGDARPLAAVLEHNRLDLLSLAGLTARLLSMVHRGCELVTHAAEALALGRVYARAGLGGRADEAWRQAAALADGSAELGGIRVEAFRALARSARRRRRFEDAAAWWREVLAVNGCPRDAAREAAEALAVHHEHRVRDLESARSFALKILEGPARPAWAEAVRHRLARIERKMGAAGPKGSGGAGPKGPALQF